jgi:dihydroorotase
MTTAFDLVVVGGRVLDPAQGLDSRMDIGVRFGRIEAIAPDLGAQINPTPDPDHPGTIVIDAKGAIVVPGLIDVHAHVYTGVCPLTVGADESSSRSGVTTVVSAGDPGAHTIEGFRQLIVGPSRTRVLAFLHISRIGMAGYPEPESAALGHLDVDAAIRAVHRFRDVIVGIKVREGGPDVIGANGLEPLIRARIVADAISLPIMVHITDSPAPLAKVLELLRPGDIVTHCFTGSPNGLLAGSKVVGAAIDARAAGIKFDVGHGAGSFDFEVAERALEAGFPPDTISTDLHSLSAPAMARDLPWTMSKLLAVGMPLPAVIAAATHAAASALRRETSLGSLAVGRVADIAVLEANSGSVTFPDTFGHQRIGELQLRARATIRAGIPWGPPYSHPGRKVVMADPS